MESEAYANRSFSLGHVLGPCSCTLQPRVFQRASSDDVYYEQRPSFVRSSSAILHLPSSSANWRWAGSGSAYGQRMPSRKHDDACGISSTIPVERTSCARPTIPNWHCCPSATSRQRYWSLHEAFVVADPTLPGQCRDERRRPLRWYRFTYRPLPLDETCDL